LALLVVVVLLLVWLHHLPVVAVVVVVMAGLVRLVVIELEGLRVEEEVVMVSIQFQQGFQQVLVRQQVG